MLDDSGFYQAQADFDPTRVEFAVIGDMPTFEVVVGMKVDIDVGFVGYAVQNLPKGLTFNAKTGKVTGTTKVAPGEYEASFAKKGAETENAVFLVRAEATPEIACQGLAEGSFTVGVAGAKNGLALTLEVESGVKSVSSKNLPTGMKLVQDRTTKQWSITGAPTKSGEFNVTITVTTTAGGKTEVSFPISVAPLPTAATGTFNGFVSNADGDNVGTVQLTSTDVGKLTAKVVDASGTYSFSAASWDTVADGVCSVTLATKKGETLALELDTTAGWNAHQLAGAFTKPGAAAASLNAQKNAFGKTWYFAATGDETDGWTLSYVDVVKSAALTVTLNADGKTTVAGKLGSYKVSASGYADVSEISQGAILADFATVVAVGKSKMVLSVCTNLQFDRNNDHGEAVGAAKFSK